VVLLDRCGCDIHRGGEALRCAVRAGDPRAVGWLLEAGADPETPVEADLTPLRWAARAGEEAVVRVLLKHRAKANARGKYGYTALMTAAMHGQLQIVKLLLGAGAEVSTNGDGETAIDLAHRFPDIVLALEQHTRESCWLGEPLPERCAAGALGLPVSWPGAPAPERCLAPGIRAR